MSDLPIRLIPVIEMPPTNYGRPDRVMPAAGSPREAWDRWWLDSLADSGIAGLRPMRPGSWHVPMEQLTREHTLTQLLHVHLRPQLFQEDEANTSDTLPSEMTNIDPEECLPFSGGYALCIGEQVMITPRCCGDLGDIAQWRFAAGYREAAVATMWIGHPGLEIRLDGDLLVFAEEEKDHAPEWIGACRVRPEALGEAITRAENDMDAFARRIRRILANTLTEECAAELAAALTATQVRPGAPEQMKQAFPTSASANGPSALPPG